MKIHVSELEGRALDYAVSVAIGRNMVPVYGPSDYGEWDEEDPIAYDPMPEYSKVWAHTGPLIDVNNIDLCCEWEGMHCATMNTPDGNSMVPDWFEDDIDGFVYGRTKLEAACRCIVAHKLGEEVEIPDELVK